MTKSQKSITKEDVQYIASLSRIHLQGDEVERLTKDLEDILRYVHKLEKLDVRAVEATSHVLPLANVYREDEVRPSLAQAEVMKVAVMSHNGFLKVPKVIQ
ncbi:MAG: asparaginyl/glutamyl-tRNA amidotransferase subunit C [Omnitrophica WOR_2 bacterium RIFCSPHIGHO2_01_FULL_52_10]|nr:MAG: asparaginyl/glutamyl-tRNA amidotransferase subunit C [Omnitrophica WOR_2 bacterium RIFCSPHIGHO2_01_FULL_52_10]